MSPHSGNIFQEKVQCDPHDAIYQMLRGISADPR